MRLQTRPPLLTYLLTVWSVCLGSSCAVTPPILAGVLGCACLRARSACTPPFLAAVFGARVRVGASASPHQSWLGIAVWMCPFGFEFWVHGADPGSGMRCGPVFARSACTPPFLAWVLGSVCLFARFARTPPILTGVRGTCVRVRVFTSPCQSWLGFVVRCWGVSVCGHALPIPCKSWLRCGFWVCFGSGSGCALPFLAGVLGCVCLCARSACTPASLAGVCGVCVRMQVSLPLRLCCGWAVGCVCRFVGSDLRGCRALFGVVRALQIGSTQRLWLPGTWCCAKNVAGGVPLWRAL